MTEPWNGTPVPPFEDEHAWHESTTRIPRNYAPELTTQPDGSVELSFGLGPNGSRITFLMTGDHLRSLNEQATELLVIGPATA